MTHDPNQPSNQPTNGPAPEPPDDYDPTKLIWTCALIVFTLSIVMLLYFILTRTA